ncbi:YeeE/YedE family protein [Sediminimonas sp.]|uniref:YeeE/YedE family protein n=1 Tax=Sediminimonas sp. TaxID=2823379 RepID=UPI0025FE751E|nr:YeeE/YedE family protein [Sediminimonas sp.]
MFETLGLQSLTAPQAAVWFALALGLAFGVMAQITRFCLRRALVGEDRRAAGAVWLTALAAALIGTQVAVAMGWVGFSGHRFMAGELPVLAVAVGGLLFGAGMVLTRGCISRLTVLGGTGNLRALMVLLVFAVAAHAALKGVLAPLRTSLGAVTLPLGDAAALPGNPWLWVALVAVAAVSVAYRAGAGRGKLILAALIGALVPLGWVGTGLVLYDDFDPIAMESLSFTSPSADTVFWLLASTSIPAGFGTGLIGGVLAGAFLAGALRGEFKWQSFDSPRQTGRYMAGAMLMGVGGVLAGGCTVGAGLSGVATLSVAAVLALAAMAAGALAMRAALSVSGRGSAGSSTTPAAQPAE